MGLLRLPQFVPDSNPYYKREFIYLYGNWKKLIKEIGEYGKKGEKEIYSRGYRGRTFYRNVFDYKGKKIWVYYDKDDIIKSGPHASIQAAQENAEKGYINVYSTYLLFAKMIGGTFDETMLDFLEENVKEWKRVRMLLA